LKNRLPHPQGVARKKFCKKFVKTHRSSPKESRGKKFSRLRGQMNFSCPVGSEERNFPKIWTTLAFHLQWVLRKIILKKFSAKPGFDLQWVVGEEIFSKKFSDFSPKRISHVHWSSRKRNFLNLRKSGTPMSSG
jgi:hypothetical protein